MWLKLLLIIVTIGLLLTFIAFSFASNEILGCPECGQSLAGIDDYVSENEYISCTHCGCVYNSTTGFILVRGRIIFEPIQSVFNSGLSVLVPVGIGIMAVMVGISLIPKIINKFF